MIGFNFSERVRKVLARARDEAQRLDHGEIGTEHILLGLLREREGVAAAVLQNLDADPNELRMTLDRAAKQATNGEATGPNLGYTSQAKDVLDLAMDEAQLMQHTYIGTEHLLIGLLREEHGLAAQALNAAGVTLEAARSLLRALDVSQRLGTPPSVTLEPDGTLTVPLGPDLLATVALPPSVRLRRRTASSGPAASDGSAEERA